MIYEIKNPDIGKDLVKFAGLISIPPKSKLSDQLFLGKWGARILRPIVKEQGVMSSNLGLSDENFVMYCEKISELLKDLKSEYSELVLIDVRFGSNFKEDVIINHKHNTNLSRIKPIIKNLEFSSFKWAENLHNDFKLIDKVTNGKKCVNAFQLEISNRIFESDSTSALRIFEEAVIYSHLSVTGQV